MPRPCVATVGACPARHELRGPRWDTRGQACCPGCPRRGSGGVRPRRSRCSAPRGARAVANRAASSRVPGLQLLLLLCRRLLLLQCEGGSERPQLARRPVGVEGRGGRSHGVQRAPHVRGAGQR